VQAGLPSYPLGSLKGIFSNPKAARVSKLINELGLDLFSEAYCYLQYENQNIGAKKHPLFTLNYIE
jgi:hypothetical protein